MRKCKFVRFYAVIFPIYLGNFYFLGNEAYIKQLFEKNVAFSFFLLYN